MSRKCIAWYHRHFRWFTETYESRIAERDENWRQRQCNPQVQCGYNMWCLPHHRCISCVAEVLYQCTVDWFVLLLHKRYIDDVVGIESCSRVELRITLPLSPIFILRCNSHIQSLKLNYLSFISIYAFQVTTSALPSTTKPLIHTAISTTIHHIPTTAKRASHTASFYASDTSVLTKPTFQTKPKRWPHSLRDAATAVKLWNMTSRKWNTCFKVTPFPKATQQRKSWAGFL